MNTKFREGALSGFVAGAALVGLGMLLFGPRPSPETKAPVPARAPVEDRARLLEVENRELRRQVADLKNVPSPAAPKEVKPADPVPPASDFAPRFSKLAESGLSALQSPEVGELLKAVKESGKPAVDFLMGVLRTSASATERFLAAALLEGAADASSVPALADALRSDKDELVRRMASHALAVLGTPAAEAPLRAAAIGDADWGVRVNSAYGLAKLKQDDGLRILQQAYESPDTPAEYRLAVLGGLADVAAPASAPLFRRILADTKEAGYLLTAIHGLEKMKDAESIPALQQIASSAQPDLVKQAAAKAIEAIRK